MQYRHGSLKREGPGLSFFYFAPTTELVQVPLSSVDVPFVFNEATADFQDATIQGQLTYRVTDPKRVAGMLDYGVDRRGQYRSEDPTKLSDRLIHAVQILARSYTQRHALRELLVSSDALIGELLAGIARSPVATMLGVEVLGLSILGIKSTPEMAKALQADAREDLLRRADEAIYARRNAAVEQERRIKENELNTEIAVEQKKRQVREAQMAADVAVEEQKAVLVDRRTANDRKEADARAHGLQAVIEPIRTLDWRTLVAAAGHADAGSVIAMAFQELAENAGKIGELNISPDLLGSLLSGKKV
jgi:hypothetical protein